MPTQLKEVSISRKKFSRYRSSIQAPQQRKKLGLQDKKLKRAHT
jgi:hypothetical protein